MNWKLHSLNIVKGWHSFCYTSDEQELPCIPPLLELQKLQDGPNHCPEPLSLLRFWRFESFKSMMSARKFPSLMVWPFWSWPVSPWPMHSPISAHDPSALSRTVMFSLGWSIMLKHLGWRSGGARTPSWIGRQWWKRTKRHARCNFPFFMALASFRFRGSKVLNKIDRNPIWNTQARLVPLHANSWSNLATYGKLCRSTLQLGLKPRRDFIICTLCWTSHAKNIITIVVCALIPLQLISHKARTNFLDF